MIRKLLMAFVLVVSLHGVMASKASAQAAITQASNISIRPFLQELTLSSTEASKQFDLIIANNSNARQSFVLSAVNFGSLNETSGIVFEGANSVRLNSYGLAGWIVLDKDSLALEPGQQTSVSVTITDGTDLTPGAHYAAIIVSGSIDNPKTAQLALKPQVSSLIFLTKLGGEHYNIHLASMTSNGGLWSPPDKVNLHIKSTGNTFIIPRGIVSLKQNGKVISKGVLNEQSSIVLPQTTRNFVVGLNKISKVNSGILFSKYQLQVDYRYEGIGRYATKTYDLTVINKFTISIIALGPIIMLGYVRLIHQNPKAHKYIKAIYKKQ